MAGKKNFGPIIADFLRKNPGKSFRIVDIAEKALKDKKKTPAVQYHINELTNSGLVKWNELGCTYSWISTQSEDIAILEKVFEIKQVNELGFQKIVQSVNLSKLDPKVILKRLLDTGILASGIVKEETIYRTGGAGANMLGRCPICLDSLAEYGGIITGIETKYTSTVRLEGDNKETCFVDIHRTDIIYSHSRCVINENIDVLNSAYPEVVLNYDTCEYCGLPLASSDLLFLCNRGNHSFVSILKRFLYPYEYWVLQKILEDKSNWEKYQCDLYQWNELTCNRANVENILTVLWNYAREQLKQEIPYNIIDRSDKIFDYCYQEESRLVERERANENRIIQDFYGPIGSTLHNYDSAVPFFSAIADTALHSSGSEKGKEGITYGEQTLINIIIEDGKKYHPVCYRHFVMSLRENKKDQIELAGDHVNEEIDS
jgi:hypothetical protein